MAFVAVAWVLGENRRKVPVKMVIAAIAAQLLAGMVLLKVTLFQQLFLGLNAVVLALAESTQAGTSLVCQL